MRILYATPEISPWVKTGGLGDVAGALPRALAALGADVRILVPGYPGLLAAFPERAFVAEFQQPGGRLYGARLEYAQTADGLDLWIIDCPAYYARIGMPYQDEHGRDWPDNYLRFGLLSRTAAWLASRDGTLPWQPDILHCNDWQSALAPAYLRYRLRAAAPTLLTIHNLAFQGIFPASTLAELDLPPEAFHIDGVEYYGSLSFLKAGLQMADWITTVSPTYAREIQSPEYGFGLDGLLRHRSGRLTGILNGIDTATRDPSADAYISCRYDAAHLECKRENKKSLQARLGLAIDERVPLLGVVSRLTAQKGLDLLAAIADDLVAAGAQLAVLGAGEHALQDGFQDLAHRHPRHIAAVIGYDDGLARQIEAGADIFLMPSRFEPCGLGQMYAMRYGTIPVVRATGGLADTVVDASPAATAEGRATGFVFREASAAALLHAIRRALDAWHNPPRWRRLQETGMRQDFGWTASARRYLDLYRAIGAAGAPEDAAHALPLDAGTDGEPRARG
ncbi:MAG: glycogen synthase GlgA [Rhodocyclaceae bacterium]